jgi:TonB family protein
MKRLVLVFVACVLASNSFAQQVTEPILRSAQMPKYPTIARTARVTGEVKAEFTLDPNGDVASVEILTGHPLLQDATRANIQTWQFDMPKAATAVELKYKTTFVYRFSGREVGDGETLRLTVTVDSFRRFEIVSDARKPIVQN